MEIKNLITNDTKIINLSGCKISMNSSHRKTAVRKDVIECWDSWYLYDGDPYFFKDFVTHGDNRSVTRFLNELIGEELANTLKIDSIHYELAKEDDKYGLASRSFYRDDSKYFFMRSLYIPLNCCNMRNLERLRDYCKNEENHNELVDEILKFVAIDIYMNQKDRTYSNFQFRKDKTGFHLAPIYDFEESVMNPRETVYESALLRIDTESKTAYKAYPDLKGHIETLFNKPIDKTMEKIEDERKIIIPEEYKDKYNSFVQERQKVLLKK